MNPPTTKTIRMPQEGSNLFDLTNLRSMATQLAAVLTPGEIDKLYEIALRYEPFPEEYSALQNIPPAAFHMARSTAKIRSVSTCSPFNALGELYNAGYSLSFNQPVPDTMPVGRIVPSSNTLPSSVITAEKDTTKIVLPIREGVDTSYCNTTKVEGLPYSVNGMKLCTAFAALYSVKNDVVTCNFQYKALTDVFTDDMFTLMGYGAHLGVAKAAGETFVPRLRVKEEKINLKAVVLAHGLYKLLMGDFLAGKEKLCAQLCNAVNVFFMNGSKSQGVFSYKMVNTPMGLKFVIDMLPVAFVIPALIDGKVFSKDMSLENAKLFLDKCRAIRGHGSDEKVALGKPLIGEYDISDEMHRILGVQYQFGHVIEKVNTIVIYSRGRYNVSSIADYLRLTKKKCKLVVSPTVSMSARQETVMLNEGVYKTVTDSQAGLLLGEKASLQTTKRLVGSEVIVQHCDIVEYLADHKEEVMLVIDVSSTHSKDNANNLYVGGFSDEFDRAMKRVPGKSYYFIKVKIMPRTLRHLKEIEGMVCISDVHPHNLTGWATNVQHEDKSKYINVLTEEDRYAKACIFANMSRSSFFVNNVRTNVVLKKIANFEVKFDYGIFANNEAIAKAEDFNEITKSFGTAEEFEYETGDYTPVEKEKAKKKLSEGSSKEEEPAGNKTEKYDFNL